MKHFNPILIILVFLTAGLPALAQQTLPAAGGKAKGSGGVVTFTVGQVTQETLSGNGTTVLQGVQIPYEIYVVTGKKEYPDITLTCTVYPNPVADHLMLKMTKIPRETLTAVLLDLNGKLINNLEINTKEISIPMGKIAPGTYLLKVTDNRKILKIFKIIKK